MTEKSNGYSLTFNPNAQAFIPNPNAQSFVPPKQLSSNDVNARCGEVAEILEDVIGYNNNEGQDDDYDGHLNDDELLEMLEMQEECRREMMKTYVQANNPGMFEEIYHNVAYPDEPIMPAEQAPVSTNFIDSIDNLNINGNKATIIDQVRTNLNPQAHEFVPKKFSDTKQ